MSKLLVSLEFLSLLYKFFSILYLSLTPTPQNTTPFCLQFYAWSRKGCGGRLMRTVHGHNIEVTLSPYKY